MTAERTTESVPSSARAGRPTVLSDLSDDDRKRLLALLRNGSPATWACKAVGFSAKTLANYRHRAESGEEPFVDFIREVDRAQAEFVVSRLQIIDADGVGAPTGDKRERGDSRNLMWLLERLHPRDFAPLQKNEHTGKDGTPLPVGEATPERAAALIREAFGDHARQPPLQEKP